MLHCSLLSLGCAFGFSPPQETAALTALRALKIAQRRLRPEVRSKLLSVSSPRTGTSLIPEAWRFVFHDAGTSGKSRAVTVAAHTSSEHPDTVEAFSGLKHESVAGLNVIAQNKWTIDSDSALEAIRSEFKFKHVRAAQYRLERLTSAKDAFWLIELFDDRGQTIAQLRVDARTAELQQLHAEQQAA